MWPHPPARSILSPRRPVTDDPLPALTTMPSPRSSVAAKPEIAVAACHNFGVWPDLETDLPERATVFLGCTTRKENSGAIDVRRQLGKNPAQTLGRGKPKIRRRQFSLLQNAKFGA